MGQVENFWHLKSTYFDLKPYVSILDASKSAFLLAKLQQALAAPASLEEAPARALARTTLVARMIRALRPLDRPEEETVQLVSDWLSKFVRP